MDKETAKQIIFSKWPNVGVLRAAFPELARVGILDGEFMDEEPNFYPGKSGTGAIVSRRLNRSDRKVLPTFGMMLGRDNYSFNTGDNTETLTVLQGFLNAGVDKGHLSALLEYGTIIVPAGKKLTLVTSSDVVYVCHYQPIK